MFLAPEPKTSWTRQVEFTPGSYLMTRRVAQQLDLHDVATRIRTQPHIPQHDLVAWIEGIEADVIPASITTIDVLHKAFRFDRSVLAALIAIAAGTRDHAHTPRICRICACSWRLPCTHSGEACAWVRRRGSVHRLRAQLGRSMTVGISRPRVAVWSAGLAIAVVLVATGMRDDTSAIIALIVLPILALAVAALDHLLTIQGSRP